MKNFVKFWKFLKKFDKNCQKIKVISYMQKFWLILWILWNFVIFGKIFVKILWIFWKKCQKSHWNLVFFFEFFEKSVPKHDSIWCVFFKKIDKILWFLSKFLKKMWHFLTFPKLIIFVKKVKKVTYFKKVTFLSHLGGFRKDPFQ